MSTITEIKREVLLSTSDNDWGLKTDTTLITYDNGQMDLHRRYDKRFEKDIFEVREMLLLRGLKVSPVKTINADGYFMMVSLIVKDFNDQVEVEAVRQKSLSMTYSIEERYREAILQLLLSSHRDPIKRMMGTNLSESEKEFMITDVRAMIQVEADYAVRVADTFFIMTSTTDFLNSCSNDDNYKEGN